MRVPGGYNTYSSTVSRKLCFAVLRENQRRIRDPLNPGVLVGRVSQRRQPNSGAPEDA